MLAAQMAPKIFGHHLPATPHFHINIAQPKFKTTINSHWLHSMEIGTFFPK
jgi:hypothetical protein